jgi:hypothetical protein
MELNSLSFPDLSPGGPDPGDVVARCKIRARAGCGLDYGTRRSRSVAELEQIRGGCTCLCGCKSLQFVGAYMVKN